MGSLGGVSHIALTVRNIQLSRQFYEQTLGLKLVDSSDTYCAFLTDSASVSALILTTHDETVDEPFTERRPGLDHLCLSVTDLSALEQWQAALAARGVPADLRSSEWGHHLNFRDPDNIALEFVVLDPDADTRARLERARMPSERGK